MMTAIQIVEIMETLHLELDGVKVISANVERIETNINFNKSASTIKMDHHHYSDCAS